MIVQRMAARLRLQVTRKRADLSSPPWTAVLPALRTRAPRPMQLQITFWTCLWMDFLSDFPNRVPRFQVGRASLSPEGLLRSKDRFHK